MAATADAAQHELKLPAPKAGYNAAMTILRDAFGTWDMNLPKFYYF
jgi:hypothetical protein